MFQPLQSSPQLFRLTGLPIGLQILSQQVVLKPGALLRGLLHAAIQMLQMQDGGAGVFQVVLVLRPHPLAELLQDAHPALFSLYLPQNLLQFKLHAVNVRSRVDDLL